MRASNARPYILVGSAVNAVGATIGRHCRGGNGATDIGN